MPEHALGTPGPEIPEGGRKRARTGCLALPAEVPK
jgi:hypothetical protein